MTTSQRSPPLHAVVDTILSEMKPGTSGTALPDARFAHWAKHLRAHRDEDPAVFGQLLALARRLQRARMTTAAAQLAALASVAAVLKRQEKAAPKKSAPRSGLALSRGDGVSGGKKRR